MLAVACCKIWGSGSVRSIIIIIIIPRTTDTNGDGLTFIGAGTAIAGIAVEIPDFGVVLRALSAAIPVSVSL